MIFKNLSIYHWAFLFLLPSVAKCRNDVPFVEGEPKLARPSAPGFRSVHERFTRNDDIDHAKPVLNNVADASTTDYEKFRIEPRGSTRRAEASESNVNVNVNHHDSSIPRWNKKHSHRSSHRPSSRQSDHHEQQLDRILQMVHMMPNANIDYNLSHPHGTMNVRKRKNSKHNSLVPQVSREDIEALGSYEDIEGQCYQLVDDALEYLISVQKRLNSLEHDLISLATQLQENNSYEDSREFEFK